MTTMSFVEHKKLCISGLVNFVYTEYKMQDIENNIDPENNLLININNSCSYYTDEQFNITFQLVHDISMIHFNSRSLYANFQSIKDYLRQLKNLFSIIAISETWLNDEKGLDFEIDGYELNYKNRVNRSGGGVAIYVHNSLKYKVVEGMTAAVDDLLECITIEICMEKSKNIVSCIYRTPGSNIKIYLMIGWKKYLQKHFKRLCSYVETLTLTY